MTRHYGEREYPEGVDLTKVDQTHNSRGDKSPYTESQRKQAAALIRTLEQDGFSHEEAMDLAFSTIGFPDELQKKIDELKAQKSSKSDNQTLRQ